MRSCLGSSPRMRGTPQNAVCVPCGFRIIPAHAGNSGVSEIGSPDLADHPRACGELFMAVTLGATAVGSSPRMRGTPHVRTRRGGERRIIPAHAGNSVATNTSVRLDPDHPRACGELDPASTATSTCRGSSPRMRGTRDDQRPGPAGYRIIPAHAGNSWLASFDRAMSSDHPRACWELNGRGATTGEPRGSSPRMRGTPVMYLVRPGAARIIPAHAGNSSPRSVPLSLTSDHPRACGELGYKYSLGVLVHGSSPRMRGTHPHSSR